MPLTVHPQTRNPQHLDPVQYVPRVPSRREAEAAFPTIVAHLPESLADAVAALQKPIAD